MKIGYARVSTTDQDLSIQIEQLTNFGCEKVFQEHKSGVNAIERKELQEAIDFCREGDVFIFYKMDRVARSLRDLLDITTTLTRKGVTFKSISEPEIDTTTPHGRLMLQILGAFAEFERSLIHERQMVGIQKAKMMGKYTGRKPKLSHNALVDLKIAFNSRNETGLSVGDIAKQFSIGRSSVYRLLKVNI